MLTLYYDKAIWCAVAHVEFSLSICLKLYHSINTFWYIKYFEIQWRSHLLSIDTQETILFLIPSDQTTIVPLSQSLPSFGPYLLEKTEVLAEYKKKLQDVNDNFVGDTNVARVFMPKKPVPAVKVREGLSGLQIILCYVFIYIYIGPLAGRQFWDSHFSVCDSTSVPNERGVVTFLRSFQTNNNMGNTYI